jgi:hypothetical protein
MGFFYQDGGYSLLEGVLQSVLHHPDEARILKCTFLTYNGQNRRVSLDGPHIILPHHHPTELEEVSPTQLICLLQF